MIRLFHASDLHFGREDEEAVRWFAERINDERPDAVVITGDLTYRARRREFEAAAEWLGALHVPATIEPGNHDLPYFNPLARFFAPYDRHRWLERSFESALNLPNVSFIPLRTTSRAQWRLNWSWGVVRPLSLQRALKSLEEAPARNLKLVLCHHPLVDTGAAARYAPTHGGEKALDALALGGADAVLSGHIHDPFDEKYQSGRRAIRLIGAGTLSERVRATPPSFNELLFEAGTLHVKVREMTESAAG